ncbi:unnamed protein product [Effrenium voratum]|uniref:PH domain-containing protein n=1 Tax=Effrenium voratum TaxID=2562239 RepID=A0AA36JJ78_9DINO|nr:unnamed protein product [Effrenium voratum]
MLRVLVIPWAQAIETALWPGHACAFPALEDEARTEVLQAYVAKTEDASHCHSLCESQGCKSFMRRKTSGECWLYQRRCAPIPRGEFDSGREVGDLSEAQRPFYRNGSELLLEDTQKIRIDDVAFGYEVLSNHMGLASRLFGVRASQDPMTLLQLQEHLWELKPDLVVEIGTECGGLASIMAELQLLSGVQGHILTVDIAPQGYAPWAHADCAERRGDSRLWHKHLATGALRPVLRSQRWGCPCRPAECDCVANDGELQQLVADYAAAASRVLVIDDSSHFKEDVIQNFELLAPFVTSGSLYVVFDTRLDRLCEAVKRLGYPLANGFNPGEQVRCDYYIDNGPASAVAALFRSPQDRFFIDRSAEHLILGSNPGGWLRAKGDLSWRLFQTNTFSTGRKLTQADSLAFLQALRRFDREVAAVLDTLLQRRDPGPERSALAKDALFATSDFSGELLRRLALRSSGNLLSSWEREWCLLTHNFLAFFASRTDLAVRKCLLLTSIQDVKHEGRNLRVSLEQGGEEVLRMPEKSQSADGWADEIRRRSEKLRAAGQGMMPCLSLAEASSWMQEALAELAGVSEERHQKVEEEMRRKRCQAFAVIFRATLSGRIRVVQREAFAELALHARIQALCRGQRMAAANRLVRAVGQPFWRQRERSLAAWRAHGQAKTLAAAKGLRRALVLLSKLLRAREADAMRQALVQLSRLCHSVRQEQKALRHFEADEFYKGLWQLDDPSRRRAAVRLLRLALSKSSRRRLSGAVRLWSRGAGERLGADVESSLRQAQSVNAELAQNNREVEVEGLVSCFVHSLGGAVQRRQLWALRNWGHSAPGGEVGGGVGG